MRIRSFGKHALAIEHPVFRLNTGSLAMRSVGFDSPRFDDLPDGFLQRLCDIPRRVVCTHLPEIGVIADVIADTVLLHVRENLRLAREFFSDLECLKDEDRRIPPSSYYRRHAQRNRDPKNKRILRTR